MLRAEDRSTPGAALWAFCVPDSALPLHRIILLCLFFLTLYPGIGASSTCLAFTFITAILTGFLTLYSGIGALRFLALLSRAVPQFSLVLFCAD